MNTSQLKSYAPAARRSFIAAVSAQAAVLGITDKETAPATVQGDVLLIAGAAFPKAVADPRKRLTDRIRDNGFHATMEAIAYTWFNRFAAIRYMELHGYLDHGYRVLSGQGAVDSGQWDRPEILEHAADVDLPGLDRAQIIELKLDGTKDEELYRLLLKAQCNALHQAMPFLFEPVGGADELLLPANLLHTDSLVRQMVEEIDEDQWQDIEIIGWLYQFYISEKKDQVIGKVVKSEDIPAATQLFTPNWIVKYMVQNSLGAQWLATYPHSPLKDSMEYYIEPAEQTDEVNAQLAAITPKSLNPEELTLIDPACGSGHILVEAYDLFKAIYLERGYRQRDVAKLILTQNLFGLDIDGRAAQLTGFALMMKGRADDRRLWEGRGARGEGRGVRLNVMALVDSVGFDAKQLAEGVELGDYGVAIGDLQELKRLFEHATTFGSLIQVPVGLAEKLPALKQLSEASSQDLFVSEALKRLGPQVRQAEMLAAQYDAVVANPPYMGGKGMNALVKKFAKDSFPGAKSDLFACFIERGYSLARDAGYHAMVTMQSWMFLSSFQKMRERMLREKTITTMAHLGARAFGSISGEVVQVTTCVLRNRPPTGYKPTFFRLLDGGEEEKRQSLADNQNRFDTTAQDEFKKIPGSPVAYWVSDQVRTIFERGSGLYRYADTAVGLFTCDNERFLRYWQEVSIESVGFGLEDRERAQKSGLRFFPIQKGGGFRKWFGLNYLLVQFDQDGQDIRLHRKASGQSYSLPGEDYYFRKGITWSGLTSGLNSFRQVGHGHVFESNKGQMLFSDSEESILGFLNSCVSRIFLQLINPTLSIQSSEIRKLPLIQPEKEQTNETVCRLVVIAELDDLSYEISWDFASLPLLRVEVRGTRNEEAGDLHSPLIPRPSPLSESYTTWTTQNRATIAEMKRLEEENNRLFIDAYGLQGELTPDVPLSQITLTVNPAYRYGGTRDEGRGARVDELGIAEELWDRFRRDTMEELISYAIGCMMGRYRLDRPGLIYAHSGNEQFWQIYGETRDEGRGTSTELSRPDRVAEVDGRGRASVPDDKGVSEGRALRTDESDPTGGGVDSVQHRRGTQSPIVEGVSPLPFDREGLNLRSGDPNLDRDTAGLRHREPSTNDHELTGRDLQNAHYHQEEAVASPLAPRPSPLFPPDDDGIVPLSDTAWFADDAANRLVDFIRVAWPAEHLEANLTFLADNLSPKKNETSRETLRRWLCDKFFKDHHLKRYKKRPIYWLFSSGRSKAFQALVYLHRYNEGTLARMRAEYVIPLQGKMAARIDKLQGDVQVATSTAHRKRLTQELTKLTKQQVELLAFDEKLRHYADKRITLDLDDGVKVNYGKFGDLLAEVKAVHGKKPEGA